MKKISKESMQHNNLIRRFSLSINLLTCIRAGAEEGAAAGEAPDGLTSLPVTGPGAVAEVGPGAPPELRKVCDR